MRRWRALLPDAEICIADSDPLHKRFQRSRARNNAALQAGGDIFIIADADTHIERSALYQGLDRACRPVLPYDLYHVLDESATARILGLEPSCRDDELRSYLHSGFSSPVCGILILPRLCFEAVGGYEELFGERWGYEDMWFYTRLSREIGVERTAGSVFHLWHEPDHPDNARLQSPDAMVNRVLFERLMADSYGSP